MIRIKGTKKKLIKMIKNGSSVRFWKISKNVVEFKRKNIIKTEDCLGQHTWIFENNRHFDSEKEAELFVNTYILGMLESLKTLEG